MTKAVLVKNIPGLEEVIVVNVRSDLPEIGQINKLYLVKTDETNGNQPTLYTYMDGVYTKISGSSNSGDGYEYQQITKLGVTATATTPKVIDIIIPETYDFRRKPVEVLKFVAGEENVVTTEVSFDNSDATDFQPDDQLIFDGTMRLKTEYSEMMTDNGSIGIGKKFIVNLDLNKFKKIEKMIIK